MMEIRDLAFVRSSPGLRSCPASNFPEYAFAGRSNVGKSSLLNLLTNRKDMAKTSSTPGKTRLINHFLVNGSWYLVDLPGYGYARAGKPVRESFRNVIGEYLLHRRTLACLFVLIDCRHAPLASDLGFITWAGENQVPLALVFTKADKLAAGKLSGNLELYRKTLLANWEELPPVFVTSSVDRRGRAEILEFIEKTNQVFKGIRD